MAKTRDAVMSGGSYNFTAADAALTRPANTTATVVGGAIGASANVLFTFSDFFEATGGGDLLTGMRLVISGTTSIAVPSSIAIRAHLFNTDVSARALSSNADAATFKTMLANEASKLGYVDFTSFTIGGTASDCFESYAQGVVNPLQLQAAATSRALYTILEARAVFTPISAGVHTLYASRASL